MPSINWGDFKFKLRARFAQANTTDDIRQQIYSKKQKAGEYTLRYIDQFVNFDYEMNAVSKHDTKIPKPEASILSPASKPHAPVPTQKPGRSKFLATSSAECPCCGGVCKSHLCHNISDRENPHCSMAHSPHVEKLIYNGLKPMCPYCHGEHSYRECPLPSEQKHRHCFVCKSLQHIASTCPSNLNKNLLKNHAITGGGIPSPQIKLSRRNRPYQAPAVAYVESLIYFPRHDLRPHATVLANKNSIEGLIDTGSHATVIGQNLYEMYDWDTELKKVDTTVITADGTRHAALGLLFVEYGLNGRTRIIPTLVLPVVMKKPILGMDFQRMFGLAMVFIDTNAIEVEPAKETSVSDLHPLSPPQQSLLTSVVETLPTVSEEGVLNCTDKKVHTIDTGNAKPVYSKPYIYSPKLQEKIRDEINRLIARGIIKRISDSSWLNPVAPVPKSRDQTKALFPYEH